MKSAVILLVEELCSIALDVRNQMKTAVTLKRTMQATVQDADNINDVLPGFALTALSPDMEESVAKATSVDPVETYFKSLAPEGRVRNSYRCTGLPGNQVDYADSRQQE
ncbi:hypothetical protein C0992_005175 [Termitomyces sp. T32_za158]|nr:hypothetical protein C0992_005175 [Termitomyces sp. T32_za158]